MENADGNGIACLGEFIDGRRERGKIGPRRAVADVDELIHSGRAPNLADFLQNLCGLVAIVGVERAADSVDADPVAGTLVAEARAPAAGGLERAIGRAADGVGAGAGNLENSRASVKCGVERDDVVADDFGACNAKIVEDSGDPFRDAGHGGAGHTAGGGVGRP